MVRFALILLGAAALALAGCQKKQSEPEARADEPFTPLEQMDAEPAASTDWYAAEPSSPAPVTPRAQTSADEVLTAAGAQTYVVQKGDTLFKLARRFYNDQSKWKDIWEANRTRLPDPDELRVGMKLIIP